MKDYTTLTNFPNTIPLELDGVKLLQEVDPRIHGLGYTLTPAVWNLSSTTSIYRKLTTCSVCKTLIATNTLRYFQKCSPKCEELAKKTKYKRGNDKRAKVKHAEIECICCGKPFVQSRSDAKYCGNNCRVKAHRANKSTNKGS